MPIDEFEKVYVENDSQQSLLSLLDGIFEGKKLFIFTSNMKDRINQYMLNRPGRIRYLAEYDSLDETVITEVIEDTLVDKTQTEDLLSVLDVLGIVSMDVLVGLITEMNSYNEGAKEAIKYLNIRPEDSQYSVIIIIDGIKVGTTSTKTHPLRIIDMYVEFYNSSTKEWDEIKITLVDWEVTREGKNITMKLEDTIILFLPSEKQKLSF